MDITYDISNGNHEEEEEETKKLERMKELEAMVQKLTIENKQLLNQVKGEEEQSQNNSSIPLDISPKITTPTTTPMDKENEFIPLGLNDIGEDEDTWLYVSPIRPPTKQQKSMTPLQWLSEGKKGIRNNDNDTFNDIKTSLVFTMNKAEELTSHMTSNVKGRQVKKARNVPVKPVMGRGIGRNSSEGFKYPNEENDNSQDEEEEEVIVERKWKVKQVPNQPVGRGTSPLRTPSPTDAVPQRQWKVKQVPNQPVGRGTSPLRTPSPTDALPQRQWKVKQVPDQPIGTSPLRTPSPRQWKVKQVPDQLIGRGTSPLRTPSPTDAIPQRQWKVKQVPDQPIGTSPLRTPSPTDAVSQRQWKVKQVPNQPVGRGTSPLRTPSPTDAVSQRQWKVKQVPDQPIGTSPLRTPSPLEKQWKINQVPDQSEGSSLGISPNEDDIMFKTWTVKQVPDNTTHNQIERRDTFTRKNQSPTEEHVSKVERRDTFTRNKEAPPQYDSDDENHGSFERRSTYTRDKKDTSYESTNYEEEGVKADHGQVERRDTFTRNKKPPTPEEEGGEGEGEEGEGGGEKKQATVKRSGTFTKDDKPKVIKRVEDGRESSASDRTASPLEVESSLKIKWTPRNPSPASSDDSRRTHSPISPRSSPIQVRQSRLTGHMTKPPLTSGLPGRGQMRIPSPARGLQKTPPTSGGVARQTPPTSGGVVQRQTPPTVGGVARQTPPTAGVQASPKLVQKQTPPSSRMLRPPSPRRVQALSNETTPPNKRQIGTTPSGTRPTSQPLPKGISPGRIKASPQGVKISQPLTPPQSGGQPPKRRTLPVPQSPKASPRSSSSGKGIKSQNKAPSTAPPQQDDSWLDDCF